MSDIERKRAYIADLYSSRGWKKKVRKMPDAQVVAIYLREHAKETVHPPTEEEKTNDDSDTIPF